MSSRKLPSSKIRVALNAARGAVKENVIAMQEELADAHKLYAETEITLPFLRLVCLDENILQMRLRIDPADSKFYVMRHCPVVWLSYYWRKQKGLPAGKTTRTRYFEFMWFSVKIRAYFRPTSHWKDRVFTFRFADTNARVTYNATSKMTDIIPPLPPPLYTADSKKKSPSSKEVKDHVFAMIRVKQTIDRLLDAFNVIAS